MDRDRLLDIAQALAGLVAEYVNDEKELSRVLKEDIGLSLDEIKLLDFEIEIEEVDGI